MAHIYKYAILKAIPDPQRGERVNVGIIVFIDGEIDVRFSEVAKLRAISNGEWSGYVAQAAERMKSIFVPHEEPSAFFNRYSLLEQVIRFSDESWFSTENTDEYEERVTQIVNALVHRPPTEREGRVKSTKINTEIAATFRSSMVLAHDKETIADHKVVRDYYISKDEELKADFVHKNGIFHVTATMDLRKPSVNISHAALKAIVLDKAAHTLEGGVKRYGVYAALPDAQQFRPHIRLLGEYSDNIFNWLDKDDRVQYTRLIYDSLAVPFGLHLK